MHHWRMRKREFFIPPEAIKPGLAPGRGLCFATDRITVEGYPVGYMYREKPDWPRDSGWRFLAGDEPPGYVDDPDNLALYDVNIIANYDPAIVPFLDASLGWAFERNPRSGTFEVVRSPDSTSGSECEYQCCLAARVSERDNGGMTRPALNLDDLTPEEQMDLLEEIWDRLTQQPAGIPLSEAQRSELDRRLDAFEEDVQMGRPLGRPWPEVRERLKSK